MELYPQWIIDPSSVVDASKTEPEECRQRLAELWLIQGSGSQVNEALEFLNEIDEFEREEAK